MKTVNDATKFRILVVGNVISNGSPNVLEDALTQQHFGALQNARLRLGGASNIARLAGEQGAIIGFLLLNEADMAAQMRQISHFHLLLSQYDVIIFSEYRSCALSGINEMVAAARRQGKKVLVDLDGISLSASTGASLVASDIETLRNMIGAWRNEEELTHKILMLLSVFNCDGCLVNRHAGGISLYVPDEVIHFPNVIQCDRYSLVAIVATSMKSGISISAAVSTASAQFDPRLVREESVMLSHNEMFS
jgi:hypothetical protein